MRVEFIPMEHFKLGMYKLKTRSKMVRQLKMITRDKHYIPTSIRTKDALNNEHHIVFYAFNVISDVLDTKKTWIKYYSIRRKIWHIFYKKNVLIVQFSSNRRRESKFYFKVKSDNCNGEVVSSPLFSNPLYSTKFPMNSTPQ